MTTYGPYYLTCNSPANQNSVVCNDYNSVRNKQYVTGAPYNELSLSPTKTISFYFQSRSDGTWVIAPNFRYGGQFVTPFKNVGLECSTFVANSSWILLSDTGTNAPLTELQPNTSVYIRDSSNNFWMSYYKDVFGTWISDVRPSLDTPSNSGLPRNYWSDFQCNYLWTLEPV